MRTHACRAKKKDKTQMRPLHKYIEYGVIDGKGIAFCLLGHFAFLHVQVQIRKPLLGIWGNSEHFGFASASVAYMKVPYDFETKFV